MKSMEQLVKARSLLILDHCFWGVLAMRLKLIAEPLCETACTDGDWIRFNPAYIDQLDLPPTIGLLAHEVMHPAMGDLWRMGNRDPLLWNMACDYINNLTLIEAGFTLPDGALVEPNFQRMSKEQVYQILKKKHPQGGRGPQGAGSSGKRKGDGQGGGSIGNKYADPGKCGSFVQPETAERAKESEVEWKGATASAAQVSQGTLPANLRRMIKDTVLDPPMPYYVLLRDFVERTARNDYNWMKPNRRWLSSKIILPSLISDEIPTIVIGDDTSGSTEGFQDRFAAEASAVLGTYQTHIIVLHCDARVAHVEEYDTQDLPIRLDPRGGGGTDFRPVFNWIEKNEVSPSCLIYFTDLYGTFPKEPPEYPVLWICVNEEVAPWGETVRMMM